MNTPMIRAEGLDKTFTLHLQGGVRLAVLRDAAITVRAGECVVLAGPSGAGKSTLLRALYGNYRIDRGRIMVRQDDAMVDLAQADPQTIIALRRATLGYVSQFLRAMPRVAARDIVAETLLARGLEPAIAQRRAAAMLERLGIAPRLHALPPATFSGGEQQRVNLARSFVAAWPILLLDEPTASLDSANRDEVVRLINEVKSAGTAVIGILHDTASRDRIADRTLTLTPAVDDTAALEPA
ncbi:MAG: phosphonate C-P lyase system protein PhnL [Proteobacteria bacterium]|nr:phosphonate C-P lyase system protein PhnL [Pseudomonadota bacterium]